MFSKQIAMRMVAIAGAALLSGATALAQMSPGGMPQQSPNPSANAGINNAEAMQQQNAAAGTMQDKDFVRGALEGGMAEVQFGQLAAQKASSDDVKQFGQRMVTDHTKLDDQMKQVAKQLDVKDPTKLSKKDRELLDKLQGLSGTQFDDTYIDAMVKDHRKDLEDFKAEAQQTQDPAVKQAAQQGEQVIDTHLQLIDKIAESHNLMTSKGKLESSGH